MEQTVESSRGITPDGWKRLSERRVFFGHQSVGKNLVDGLSDLIRANPRVPLRVEHLTQPSAVEGPGLYHARVGENGRPETKLADFRRYVATAGSLDVALLKFCYLDVTAKTDPKALLVSYKETVDELRRLDPAPKIVHVTIPLTVDPGTFFHFRTRIRGKTTLRELNSIRHRYNELLRSAYGGREAIFDLAQLQATDPAGRHVVFGYRGDRVPALAPVWTPDRGHLTPEAGRRMVAVLVAILANL